MAQPRRIEELVSQLRNYRTRAQARRALAEVGPTTAPALIGVLQDSEAADNTLWSAMTLLAEWKHEPAMPALLEIMKTCLNLRGEAVRALQAITGEEIGEDDVAWTRVVTGEEPPIAAAPEDGEADDEASPTAPSDEPDEHIVFFREALDGVANKVQWEASGYLYTRIPLPEDRKQQILITFNEEDAVGEPLTTFYTECGTADSKTIAVISRRNVSLQFGAFHIEDEEKDGKKVVMRHKVPTKDLTQNLAREIVETMARDADALEFKLTQADHI